MPVPRETIQPLADIPNVTVSEGPLLSRYTRFGIGGPAEVFADQRTRLEHEWAKGDSVSTEDLRQALRKYRSFFDRLLSAGADSR